MLCYSFSFSPSLPFPSHFLSICPFFSFHSPLLFLPQLPFFSLTPIHFSLSPFFLPLFLLPLSSLSPLTFPSPSPSLHLSLPSLLPSLLFPSHPFPITSLSFPSLPYSSIPSPPFPSLPFPSLPLFPSHLPPFPQALILMTCRCPSPASKCPYVACRSGKSLCPPQGGRLHRHRWWCLPTMCTEAYIHTYIHTYIYTDRHTVIHIYTHCYYCYYYYYCYCCCYYYHYYTHLRTHIDTHTHTHTHTHRVKYSSIDNISLFV